MAWLGPVAYGDVIHADGPNFLWAASALTTSFRSTRGPRKLGRNHKILPKEALDCVQSKSDSWTNLYGSTFLKSSSVVCVCTVILQLPKKT